MFHWDNSYQQLFDTSFTIRTANLNKIKQDELINNDL